MDFDFSQIPVPFAMRPGLRRLDPSRPPLTALRPGSRLAQEKQAVFAAARSRHAVAGFDPGPALAALAERCAIDGAGRFGAHEPPELAFEEDLAVLDGADATLPWLCVCVPSHWAPEEKLGLDFAAVHAPVADNQALLAASRRLVALVTAGECWERQVWTITPSGRYDQHPARHPRAAWPATCDPEAFAGQCWLRAERQAFFPVGRGTRQAVFTIRVMLQPLAEAARGRSEATRLRDALASMSHPVLAYKNLLPARERLLHWLSARAQPGA